MIDLEKFSGDLLAIREQSPLVVNITNYVAMNIAANALLAVGASPIMSFYEREMDELLAIAGALTVNIGCLDDNEIAGMKAAVAAAAAHGKPWVLDPVGAGASRVRTQTAADLLAIAAPAIIRGNASEIICLNTATGGLSGAAPSDRAAIAAGDRFGADPSDSVAIATAGECEAPPASKGVDSTASTNAALPHAISLARRFGCTVSVSGAVDYITDGERVETIRNGSPLMARITAMGCTATAITGAFVSVSEPFTAALGAMALMGVAGELAAGTGAGVPEGTGGSWISGGTSPASGSEAAVGTGSMAVRFIDVLSTASASEIAKLVRQ